jgi:hypothetical protein
MIHIYLLAQHIGNGIKCKFACLLMRLGYLEQVAAERETFIRVTLVQQKRLEERLMRAHVAYSVSTDLKVAAVSARVTDAHSAKHASPITLHVYRA